MQKKIFINGLPVIVSSMVLCSLLNISKQNFLQWQQHTSFPKDAKVKYGFYDLQRVIEFRDTCIYGDAEIAKEIQKEKLKYQKFRSEQQKLETEKLQGILVIKEELLRKFTESIIIAKDAIWLWAKRLPVEFGLEREKQKQVAEIIQREARLVLTTWASGVEAIKNYKEESSSNEKKEIIKGY